MATPRSSDYSSSTSEEDSSSEDISIEEDENVTAVEGLNPYDFEPYESEAGNDAEGSTAHQTELELQVEGLRLTNTNW